MKLHKNEKYFSQIVTAVSLEKQIPEEQVEKDYFISLLLQKIVERVPEIIFKGGTSLSKCYKLINRFSEDIDINYNKGNGRLTRKDKRELKNNIMEAIKDAQLDLTNQDSIRSGRDHNIYEVKYPNLIEHTGTLKEHLVIETFLAYKSFPCERKMVSCYILDYLIEKGEFEIINEFCLKEFEINVQTLERTFIDKIFAILDYAETGQLDKNSRHLYDLHMIWNKIFNVISQDTKKFSELFNDVVFERSSNTQRNVSAQNGYMIHDQFNKIIENELYKNDYETITFELMFKNEDIISYQSVIESLKNIMDSGLIPPIIEINN